MKTENICDIDLFTPEITLVNIPIFDEIAKGLVGPFVERDKAASAMANAFSRHLKTGEKLPLAWHRPTLRIESHDKRRLERISRPQSLNSGVYELGCLYKARGTLLVTPLDMAISQYLLRTGQVDYTSDFACAFVRAHEALAVKDHHDEVKRCSLNAAKPKEPVINFHPGLTAFIDFTSNMPNNLNL